jgi:hypothetical protein
MDIEVLHGYRVLDRRIFLIISSIGGLAVIAGLYFGMPYLFKTSNPPAHEASV